MLHLLLDLGPLGLQFFVLCLGEHLASHHVGDLIWTVNYLIVRDFFLPPDVVALPLLEAAEEGALLLLAFLEVAEQTRLFALFVSFEGTEQPTLLDFLWLFGDGEESRGAMIGFG